MHNKPAPVAIRLAGVVVGLQGLAGIGFGIALIFPLLAGAGGPGNNVLATVVYYLLLGVGVTLVGVLLGLGRRGARTPAVVVQLVLLGVAWFLGNGSGLIVDGVLLAVLCAGVLVALFVAPSRRWAQGIGEYDDSAPAGPAADAE